MDFAFKEEFANATQVILVSTALFLNVMPTLTAVLAPATLNVVGAVNLNVALLTLLALTIQLALPSKLTLVAALLPAKTAALASAQLAYAFLALVDLIAARLLVAMVFHTILQIQTSLKLMYATFAKVTEHLAWVVMVFHLELNTTDVAFVEVLVLLATTCAHTPPARSALLPKTASGVLLKLFA